MTRVLAARDLPTAVGLGLGAAADLLLAEAAGPEGELPA